jgi:hypothetical protein
MICHLNISGRKWLKEHPHLKKIQTQRAAEKVYLRTRILDENLASPLVKMYTELG